MLGRTVETVQATTSIEQEEDAIVAAKIAAELEQAKKEEYVKTRELTQQEMCVNNLSPIISNTETVVPADAIHTSGISGARRTSVTAKVIDEEIRVADVAVTKVDDVAIATSAMLNDGSTTVMDSMISSLLVQYNKEIDKGENADPDVLHRYAIRMLKCLMRRGVRIEQEHINEMMKETDSLAKKHQESFRVGWAIPFAVMSAVLNFGAGFCGLSPLIGKQLLLSIQTTKTLATAAHSVSAMGHGAGTIQKIMDEEGAGKRTGLQFLVEKSREETNTRRTSRGDFNSEEKGAAHTERDTESKRHNVWSNLTGSTAG